jgi:hypothetical protein
MTYGQGLKNVLRRSIPPGKTMLNQDILPAGKLHYVRFIRKKFLAATNVFVDAVFLPEPLISTKTSKRYYPS